jgi:ubiquinol-cytochrome c reductase cytochrome b/c1 subunit
MTIPKRIALALVATLAAGPTFAAEEQKEAKDVSFSFEGPFGTFDRVQLQHGYKVYKEICAGCHSLKLVAFRNLGEPGGPEFTEEQVKALAASVTDKYTEIGDDGEPKARPGLPSDPLPSPYANEQAARYTNNGSLPPDLSLTTKSRAGWTGTFTQLVHGIGGPEYVYSVLTGYEEPPAELAAEAPEGKSYNPYFANGHWIGMPAPLSEGAVKYDDKPQDYVTSVDEMARDVSAFLAWAAEPKMEERKATGFSVMIYLAVLAVLLFLVKQKIWSRVEH